MHFFRFACVEFFKETCLNCGFQRRLYNKFRGLTLPVFNRYTLIQVLYFTTNDKHHQKIEITLPDACEINIQILKFLVLSKMSKKSKRNVYSSKILNKYSMVMLNNRSKRKNTNLDFNDFGQILSDETPLSEIMQRIGSNESTLLITSRINVAINSMDVNNQDDNSNHNNDKCTNATAGTTNVLYAQVINTSPYLLVSVLIFPQFFTFNLHTLECIMKAQNGSVLKYYQSFIVNKNQSTMYFNGHQVNNENQYNVQHSSASNNKMINFVTETKNPTLGTDGFGININTAFDYHNDMHDLDDDIIHYHLRLQGMMSLIHEQIEEMSIDHAIDHLEKRISKIKTKQNLAPKANNISTHIGKTTKEESKMHLKAYENILKQIKEAKNKRSCDQMQFFLSLLSKSIETLWKSSELDKLNGGYISHPCETLKDCWKTYTATTYSYRDNLLGTFRCKCVEDGSILPLIETKRIVAFPPRLMIISLDRNSGKQKQNHGIKFGSCLDSQFDCTFANNKRKLISICIHKGTAGFGHYFVIVKQLGSKNQWFKCDDDAVTDTNIAPWSKDAIMMIYSH